MNWIANTVRANGVFLACCYTLLWSEGPNEYGSKLKLRVILVILKITKYYLNITLISLEIMESWEHPVQKLPQLSSLQKYRKLSLIICDSFEIISKFVSYINRMKSWRRQKNDLNYYDIM